MKKYLILLLIFFIADISYSSNRLSVKEYEGIIKGVKSDVIVVFWASYCSYCKKEIKELHENNLFLSKKHINVILVAIDKVENSAKRAYKKLNVNYPFYLASEELVNHINARFVPITAVYNEKGELVDIAPGYKTFDEILEMLKE